MHGDYRLDNMLFDPDRTRITVVDWQTVGIGLPGRDLAYFTATSLDPAVRSRNRRGPRRRSITERYSGYGITDYDLDTCWRDYRLGVRAGAAAHRPSAFAFAASTERGDDMMLTMLQPRLPGDPRAGHARADQVLPSRPDPGRRVVDGGHRCHSGGQRRTVHHHHRDTECGRGIQLRPGHVAAAVLRHQTRRCDARRSSARSSS